MAESFDAYHKWLGIPPKDQPPDHYRLLAIERFENDPDVIEGAADRQMAHVRTFQTGQNSALSQQLLNELSAAKVCLLDPQKRAEYDRQLRDKLDRSKPQSEIAPAQPIRPIPLHPAAPAPIANSAGPDLPGVGISTASRAARSPRKTAAWRQPAVLGTGGAAALFAVVAYFIFSGGRAPQDVKPVPSEASAVAPGTGAVARASNASDAGTSPGAAPIAPQIVEPSNSQNVEPPNPQPAVAASGLEILKAAWSVGDKTFDVTDGLRRLVQDDRLMMIVWSGLFGAPEGAEGGAKKLRLTYLAHGKKYDAEAPDSWFLYLDGKAPVLSANVPEGLEVLEARYGAGKTFVDVLPQLREYVRDGRLSVTADQFATAAADQLAQQGINADAYKVLWVRYRTRTGEHVHYAWNSERLTLDTTSPRIADGPVDLLKKIDVRRDAVQGDWKLDGKGLAAPGGKYDRLQLPAEVPDEYVLTAVVESDGDLRDVSVGLPVDGRQVLCCLDGGNGLSSGLNLIDGAWFVRPGKNPTFSWRMARRLEQGRPNTLTYLVRKTSLRVLRDGAEIVRWSGDPKSFSLSPNYEVPNPQSLFLQSFDVPFRVTKLALTPLAPDPSPVVILRETTNLDDESTEPVDALAAIDLDRDVVHGEWRRAGKTLVSPESAEGRMQLPVVVPANYRLNLIAQRAAGNDALSFTLPIAGSQASLWIDARGGTLSGLQQIDGKDVEENESKRESSAFADGQAKSIEITVRGNRVQASCDGRPLADWSGDVSRLSPTEPAPYKDRVYLGSHASQYRLTKIELTPLSPAAAPVANPVATKTKVKSPPATEPPGPKMNRPIAGLGALARGKADDTRQPPPDDEALKKARQDLQKKLAGRIGSAKLPEQKRLLAQELSQQTIAQAEDAAERYVLMTQAVDLAEAAGDLDLAWQLVDKLAAAYAVNGDELRQQSLVDLGKLAKSPQQNWELADAACRLMTSALAEGDGEAVKSAGTQAQSFARRTKDKWLQKAIMSRAADAGKLADELEAVAAARETLATAPDDPQANLTVGRFELCATGDWNAALPKLMKSADPAWQKAANDERALSGSGASASESQLRRRLAFNAQPADAARQLAVADAWWSLAEHEPWPGRHFLQMRAALWYGSAVRSLVDVERVRAALRLKMMLANDEGLPSWELFRRQGFQSDPPDGNILRVDGRGGGVESAVEYDSAIDVTMAARTTGTKINLSSHRWGWGWKFSVVPNRWHTLRFVITPVSQTVFVDGISVFADAQETPRKLNSAPVSIYSSDDDVIEIRKFLIKPL